MRRGRGDWRGEGARGEREGEDGSMRGTLIAQGGSGADQRQNMDPGFEVYIRWREYII